LILRKGKMDPAFAGMTILFVGETISASRTTIPVPPEVAPRIAAMTEPAFALMTDPSFALTLPFVGATSVAMLSR
jgi:hypothetical protein